MAAKRKVRFIRDKIDEGVLNGEDGELYRYGELFVRRGKLKSMFKIFRRIGRISLIRNVKLVSLRMLC